MGSGGFGRGLTAASAASQLGPARRGGASRVQHSRTAGRPNRPGRRAVAPSAEASPFHPERQARAASCGAIGGGFSVPSRETGQGGELWRKGDGTFPTSGRYGVAKISVTNPIEMKVSETPEIAASIAARGMSRRSPSAKKTPARHSTASHVRLRCTHTARCALCMPCDAALHRQQACIYTNPAACMRSRREGKP